VRPTTAATFISVELEQSFANSPSWARMTGPWVTVSRRRTSPPTASRPTRTSRRRTSSPFEELTTAACTNDNLLQQTDAVEELTEGPLAKEKKAQDAARYRPPVAMTSAAWESVAAVLVSSS
jgi:hypothetical protein